MTGRRSSRLSAQAITTLPPTSENGTKRKPATWSKRKQNADVSKEDEPVIIAPAAAAVSPGTETRSPIKPARISGRKRKAQALEEEEEEKEEKEEGEEVLGDEAKASVAPITPPRNPTSRSTATNASTPAAVSLVAEPAAGVPETPKLKPRALSQLAATDVNATHATLISPQSSRIIKPRTTAAAVAEAGSPGVTATICVEGDLLERACRHLISVDARMEPLIEQHHCRIFSAEGLAETIDPFESLTSGIISQQVSGAAARAIKARFVALFARDEATDAATSVARFPSPSAVAACSMDSLRSAGLSQRKAEYVQGLATKFASGELSASMLADAPYEEVIEKLTAVRGLGKWSVEMFACFGLKRPDVFSLGDLGVQRGMAAFVGRDVSKLRSKGGKWKYMSEKEMEDMSAKFAPYRSLFMWYMWRVEETDVSTLE